MSEIAKAVVTDAHFIMSLAIIRALGKNSIPVVALESKLVPKKNIIGFHSKYVQSTHLIADSKTEEQEFIKDLISLGKQEADKCVLIPVTLDSIMAVSNNKEQLQTYYDFVVPSLQCIEIANDTSMLIDIAEKASVPVPITTTIRENETVEELANRVTLPAVIKYRSGELLKFKPEKRYKIVHTKEQFIKHFTAMHSIQSYPLVQEYISGGGFGVSAVFDADSNPVQVFCHRRIREYPATGGPSCMCESIWDDKLVKYALDLLSELKWQGVAMVEFKGYLDGKIALMEINPRIWGSYPLADIAGADFTYSIYKTSLGAKGSRYINSPSYSLHKRMRYFFKDVLSFKGYLSLRKDKGKLAYEFLSDLINPFIKDGVITLKDFKPSIKYISQLIKKL
ncbi:MAG: ATP-grasp domain-containing protein [Lutisporaceae bacterium]